MATNNVKFLVSAKDTASKTLNTVGKNITGLQGKLSKFGPALKKAGIGFAAVGTAAFLAGKQMVALANDQIRVETALDAVLKSTENAAGLTADAIKDMASELQGVTTIGDEAIISGQNMLLTFTNIGKEAFKPTTEIMLDMATALNQGVTPSAEQLQVQAIALGKALNDPIKGVTALSRVGVAFTEDQKEMITTLQESGDILGAQQIILAELGKEFGGQARAQAKTFEGQMQQLSNTIGDTKEVIGMALIPAIQETMTSLRPVIDAINEWILANPELTANIIKGAVALGLLAGGIFAITTIFGPLILAVKALGTALLFLSANPIGLIITAIAAGIAIGILIVKNWDTIKAKAIEVFTALGQFFTSVFGGIWNTIKGFGSTISLFFSAQWDGIKSIFSSAITAISDGISAAFNFILEVITNIFQNIVSVFAVFFFLLTGDWQKAWENIKFIFEDTWNLLMESLSLILEGIKIVFTTVWDGIRLFLISTLDLIKVGILAFINLIKNIFTGFINALKFIWNNGWDNIKSFAVNTLNGIVSFFKGFGPAISEAFSSMFEGIGNIAKNIFNGIIGTIEGFINFFIAGINKLINAANEVPGVNIGTISPIHIGRLAHGGIAGEGTFGGEKFQNGGVVTGPAGIDKVPALLSAGEVVLNAAQQSTLANQLNRGKGSKQISISISGNSFFGDDDDFIEKIGNTLLDKFSASTAYESF